MRKHVALMPQTLETVYIDVIQFSLLNDLGQDSVHTFIAFYDSLSNYILGYGLHYVYCWKINLYFCDVKVKNTRMT